MSRHLTYVWVLSHQQYPRHQQQHQQQRQQGWRCGCVMLLYCCWQNHPTAGSVSLQQQWYGSWVSWQSCCSKLPGPQQSVCLQHLLQLLLLAGVGVCLQRGRLLLLVGVCLQRKQQRAMGVVMWRW